MASNVSVTWPFYWEKQENKVDMKLKALFSTSHFIFILYHLGWNIRWGKKKYVIQKYLNLFMFGVHKWS